MKQKITYEAFDGTQFTSMAACAQYEINHNFYAQYACIPFYNIDWENISGLLNSDLIDFSCQLYGFTAKDGLDIVKVKELFTALGLSTMGIHEPGNYHLDWYEDGWFRERSDEEE